MALGCPLDPGTQALQQGWEPMEVAQDLLALPFSLDLFPNSTQTSVPPPSYSFHTLTELPFAHGLTT